ncbi:MAG: transposase [Adhaeribacter sp.]
MSKRVFDASFKRIAIDLSYARGSVKEVANKLEIDPGRISKWHQQFSKDEKATGLTDEQKEIRRLQKELKDTQLEREMDPMLTQVCRLKKAVSIFFKGNRQ